MPYTINLSNGDSLVTVQDGTLIGPLNPNAPSNCSLNLIGRNSVNYGLSTNTDFVWLMENFAAATAPISPLVGQIWYNTSATGATLNLQNTSNDWVQIYTSDSPLNLMDDITVYDGLGDSSRLGANGIITLVRADYKPRIIFEGVTNSSNSATIELGTDAFGNPDLNMISNNTTGFLWHSANLSPFDLNKNNKTANVISNFYGEMFLNDKPLVTIDQLLADLSGYLPLTGGTMSGLIDASAAGLLSVTLTATDNSTNVATTQFVHNLLTQTLGNYLPLSGGTMTGLIDASAAGMLSITYATSDNSIKVATTGFVHNLLSNNLAGYLPLAGGTMTGPVALDGATTPTPAAGDDSTNVATTAFVHSAIQSIPTTSVPQPSNTVPLVASGGGSIGSDTGYYALADHVHPASSSGSSGGNPTGFGNLYTYTYAYYLVDLVAGSSTPYDTPPTILGGSSVSGSTFVIPFFDQNTGNTTYTPAILSGTWMLMSTPSFSANAYVNNSNDGNGGGISQQGWVVAGLFQRTA